MLAMPDLRAVPKVRTLLVLPALAFALALGGCDKCGNRVHFNVPSPQQSCGDNAQAPR